MSSLDLFGFFTEHFHISSIYTYGWKASEEWMAAISGVLIILALGFRWIEEQAALLKDGKNKLSNAMVTVVLVAVGVGLYHVLVAVIIDFFNAIYGSIGNSDNLMYLGRQLDELMSKLQGKEYSFSLSEVVNGAYFIFAMVIYAVTYGILVFTTIFMRISHALLVTFAVFWGAVALPMSITTGFKMLSSLRVIALTTLFWPIVDAFFIYLISATFFDAMISANAEVSSMTNWDLAVMLFYLAIFSIINLILTATTISAPFIAQGLANGTGNVTGMIASFAGAGIAAGAIAGKYLTKNLDAVGSKMGKSGLDGFRKTGNKMGASIDNHLHPTARNPVSMDLGKNINQPMEGSSKAVNLSSSPGGKLHNSHKPQAGNLTESTLSSTGSTPQENNRSLDNVSGNSHENKATPEVSNASQQSGPDQSLGKPNGASGQSQKAMPVQSESTLSSTDKTHSQSTNDQSFDKPSGASGQSQNTIPVQSVSPAASAANASSKSSSEHTFEKPGGVSEQSKTAIPVQTRSADIDGANTSSQSVTDRSFDKPSGASGEHEKAVPVQNESAASTTANANSQSDIDQHLDRANGDSGQSDKGIPSKVNSNLSNSSNVNQEQQMMNSQQELEKPDGAQDSEALALEDMKRKKESQAKRGAIVNKIKKGNRT